MIKHDAQEPTNNLLLSQLPKSEYNRLVPKSEYIPLDLGTVLFDSDKERNYAYFPTEGIVSVVQILEEGASSETALIGNDGMVGITTILGGKTNSSRVVVQGAGGAYRISAPDLREEFARGGVLMKVLLLFIQVLYTQVSQTAVCNRHHNLQQQLCRWLLLSLDRTNTDEIAMTQELIAGMLGVRREGVTRAARELQRQHVIEYRRGSITVVDRDRLEALCCECYNTITSETRRLFALQKSIS